jgi:hypothetical protein
MTALADLQRKAATMARCAETLRNAFYIFAPHMVQTFARWSPPPAESHAMALPVSVYAHHVTSVGVSRAMADTAGSNHCIPCAQYFDVQTWLSRQSSAQ